MKKTLAKLAQEFANGGKHHDLAGTIIDQPRKAGERLCPCCLGTEGRRSIMRSIGRPADEVDTAEEFMRCGTCNTTYAKDVDLWRVV